MTGKFVRTRAGKGERYGATSRWQRADLKGSTQMRLAECGSGPQGRASDRKCRCAHRRHLCRRTNPRRRPRPRKSLPVLRESASVRPISRTTEGVEFHARMPAPETCDVRDDDDRDGLESEQFFRSAASHPPIPIRPPSGSGRCPHRPCRQRGVLRQRLGAGQRDARRRHFVQRPGG